MHMSQMPRSWMRTTLIGVLASLSLLPGCADVPGVDKFLFATNADRDDAVAQADVDVVAGEDVATADGQDTVGAPDTADTTDGIDAPDGTGTDVQIADADAAGGDDADAAPDGGSDTDAATDTTSDTTPDIATTDATTDADTAVDIDAGPQCATIASCDDGDFCTTDACVDGTGCTHTPNGPVICADNDACTQDLCDAVKGCGHPAVVCDDQSACTTDSCQTLTGCATAPITCDDGKDCTQDGCDPAVGCTATVLDQTACNDGDACTSGDTCASGTCVGKAIVCQDTDPCTVDACDAAKGCTFTLNVALTCDDGDPCTENDSCSSGKCAGTARLWTSSIATDQDILAIAARPAGGFVTITHQNKLSMLRAWTSAGTVEWTATLPFGGPREGVTVTPDGRVLAVGTLNTGGSLALFSPAGVLLAQKALAPGIIAQLSAVVNEPAGGFHALGQIQKTLADPGDAWFVDVGDDGTPGKDTSAGGPAFDGLYGAAPAADGGHFYYVGQSTQGTDPSGLIVYVNAGPIDTVHGVPWTYAFPSSGPGKFSHVAAADDGGALAIGDADLTGSGQSSIVLARVDGNGKLLWSQVGPASGSKTAGTGVVALSDGRWMTASVVGTTVSISLLQADGTALWTHTSANSGDAMIQPLADGTVVIAGAVGGVFHIRRVDLFDNASCTASGACLGLTPADCEDQNACTSDECAGGTCIHPTYFEGTPCIDDNLCHAGGKCSGGTCVGGTDVLGITTDNQYGSAARVGALPNGGWAVLTAGATPPSSQSLIGYTASGTQAWSKSLTGMSPATMFTDNEGSSLVLGTDSMSMSTRVRQYSVTGALTGDWTVTLKDAQSVLSWTGGTELSDGSYVLLGHDTNHTFLIRMGNDGSIYDQHTIAGTVWAGIVATDDGNVCVSGSSMNGGNFVPFVAKVTPWGNELWRYQYTPPPGEVNDSFSAPIATPSGGCAVSVAADTVRVLRLAADGSLQRTDVFTTAGVTNTSSPSSLVGMSDGGVVVAVTGAQGTSVTRLDAYGNQTQQLQLNANTLPGFNVGLARSTSDRIAVAGGQMVNGATSLSMWRLDGFLNQQCTTAGNCAGTLTSACVSQNSCIIDSCQYGQCTQKARKTGSACTDGSACTYGDTCTGGQCVAGSPILGVWTPATARGLGVVPWGDKTAFIAQDAFNPQRVVVERHTATGDFEWAATSTAGHEISPLHTVIASSGNLLVPGYDALKDSAWIGEVKPDGTFNGEGATFDAGTSSRFNSIVAGTSLYYAIGTKGVAGSGSSGQDYWIVPFNVALGQLGTTWTLNTYGTDGKPAEDVATSAAMATDGKLLIAGTATTNNGQDTRVHLVKFDGILGTQSWEYYQPILGANAQTAVDIAPAPDGGAFLVGAGTGAKNMDVWIARVGTNGTPLWSRTVDDSPGSATDDIGYGAAALADGSLVAVGMSNGPHLWRFSSVGASIGDWSLLPGVTTWGVPATRVALANTGGLLIAGQLPGTAPNGALFHTDLFGNQSCASSGTCIDLNAQSCDDNNPCTLDACATSCVHTNLVDGVACDDGDACTTMTSCAAGVCTNGSSSLWSAPEPDGLLPLDGVQRGGGFVTIANPGVNLNVRQWDAAGSPGTSTVLKGIGTVGKGRFAVGGDGSLLIAGQTSDAVPDGWVVKLSASTTLQWNTTPGSTSSAEDRFSAIIPRWFGGYWAVGTHKSAGGTSLCWAQAVDGSTGAAMAASLDFGVPGESTDCLNAQMAGGGGAFAVAGTAKGGGTVPAAFGGFVGLVAGDGTIKWTSVYHATTDAAFNDAVPTQDNGALAVGHVGTTAGTDTLLVRFNSTGIRLWVRQLDWGADDDARRVNLRSDGSFDVAGSCGGDVCLTHFSASGSQQWQRTWSAGVATGMYAMPNGGLLLTSSATDHSVIRVDWSGNLTCDESGGCAGWGPTDCSDSGECNERRCTYSKCQSNPLADFVTCEDGQPCTGGDYCQSGKCEAGTAGTCGDGICSCTDTAANCPADCP